MVYTCCVPECNTGYRSAKNVEKIAMFRFPSDEEFCHKWIEAIPRKNFNVTNSTRICANILQKMTLKLLQQTNVKADSKKEIKHY